MTHDAFILQVLIVVNLDDVVILHIFASLINLYILEWQGPLI